MLVYLRIDTTDPNPRVLYEFHGMLGGLAINCQKAIATGIFVDQIAALF
jgi:hypothetical protein